MRLLRSTFLVAATLCLSTGPAAAWVAPASEGSAPEEPNVRSAMENAPTLDELLSALGLGGLAVDMFLKIEGIEGESTAAGDGHKDWIVIDSFAWGGSNTGSAAGRTRRNGGTTFADVSVVKGVDASSPHLYLACAQGKHFPKATIHLVRSDDPLVPYMVYELENVRITSVGVSHSAGSDVPVEEVTLNYGKITWEYTPQDARRPGGSVRTGWDLEQNTGG